jgi:transcriptional regulator with XRE-family HTH domain
MGKYLLTLISIPHFCGYVNKFFRIFTDYLGGEKMTYNGLGERIKQSIKNSSYNQKEISALLRISEDSLTRYTQEKQSPKAETLIKLCELLNVSINWLLTGEEEEKLNKNEKELLNAFRKLPEREQIKLIGIAEQKAEEQSDQKLQESKIG